MAFSRSTIFVPTSTDGWVALRFADSAKRRDDTTGIPFPIAIDVLISSTPFASFNNTSHFRESEK